MALETKVLLFAALYFLPSLLAPRGWRFLVFFTNLYFGWTVIGWFWALHTARIARARAAYWRRGGCFPPP